MFAWLLRYGIHLKLLTIKPEDAEERLTQLLKKCGYYLQQQQRTATSSKLRILDVFRPKNHNTALNTYNYIYCLRGSSSTHIYYIYNGTSYQRLKVNEILTDLEYWDDMISTPAF